MIKDFSRQCIRSLLKFPHLCYVLTIRKLITHGKMSQKIRLAKKVLSHDIKLFLQKFKEIFKQINLRPKYD